VAFAAAAGALLATEDLQLAPAIRTPSRDPVTSKGIGKKSPECSLVENEQEKGGGEGKGGCGSSSSRRAATDRLARPSPGKKAGRAERSVSAEEEADRYRLGLNPVEYDVTFTRPARTDAGLGLCVKKVDGFLSVTGVQEDAEPGVAAAVAIGSRFAAIGGVRVRSARHLRQVRAARKFPTHTNERHLRQVRATRPLPDAH
jgi:hypothetical protein